MFNNKIILVFGIILLLLFSSIIPISMGHDIKIPDEIIQSSFSGNTLYVGGSGSDNYTRIQDAIDNASDGDTVFVYAHGSPYNENIWINKSINLIGENKYTTIIESKKIGNLTTILSDDVLISGFNFTKNGEIVEESTKNIINCVKSNNVKIENNIIFIDFNTLRWETGIYIKESSNNIIKNNVIFSKSRHSKTEGISIDYGSNFNNISENEVYNFSFGIIINLLAENNTIYNNYVHHNNNGINTGSGKSKIINNLITQNEFNGIQIASARLSEVIGNTILFNGVGDSEESGGINIYHMLSLNSEIIISGNNISYNNPSGIFIFESHGNKIIGNNFINNVINAYFVTKVFSIYKTKWNGNYWSDYNYNKIFPKIIKGESSIFFNYFLPWINIDWNPAQEPYEI